MGKRNVKTNIAYLCESKNAQELRFLTSFRESHDIFVFVENKQDAFSLQETFQHLTFVYIEDQILVDSYLVKSNISIKNRISLWDRALYFFMNNEINVATWFLQDNVFVPSSSILANIDEKYKEANVDYIGDTIKTDHCRMFEHPRIKERLNTFPIPWCVGQTSVLRVSSKLLKLAKENVEQHKSSLHIACLFSTLAYHNDLNIVDCSRQFKFFPPKKIPEINLKKESIDRVFNKNNTYCPMPDIELHSKIRNLM